MPELTEEAASITKSATFPGCESRGTWLLGRVSVLEPILLAVLASCSGEMARSFEAMTNQLGFERQAAFLMDVARMAPWVAPFVASTMAFSSGRDEHASFKETRGLSQQKQSA